MRTHEDFLNAVLANLVCRSCAIPWSMAACNELCPDAHRDTWPHEWVSKYFLAFIDKTLEAEGLAFDKIRELEAENAWLRDRRKQVAEVLAKMHKRIKSQRRSLKGRQKGQKNLHTDNARLRAALVKYGDHTEECVDERCMCWKEAEREKCYCGWDELQKSLEPAKGATDG